MIFIDTGAFIARYMKYDQYHQHAMKKWGSILKNPDLCTSNHIIDETITFLLRRTNPDFAVEKAEILLSTDVIHTLRSDQEDEQEALEILKRYKDQKLSFTDCITSALMKRYKIDRIFTFDSHFRLFGYHVL